MHLHLLIVLVYVFFFYLRHSNKMQEVMQIKFQFWRQIAEHFRGAKQINSQMHLAGATKVATCTSLRSLNPLRSSPLFNP